MVSSFPLLTDDHELLMKDKIEFKSSKIISSYILKVSVIKQDPREVVFSRCTLLADEKFIYADIQTDPFFFLCIPVILSKVCVFLVKYKVNTELHKIK